MKIKTLNGDIFEANIITVKKEFDPMSTAHYILRNEKGFEVARYFTKEQADLMLKHFENREQDELVEPIRAVDKSVLDKLGYKIETTIISTEKGETRVVEYLIASDTQKYLVTDKIIHNY